MNQICENCRDYIETKSYCHRKKEPKSEKSTCMAWSPWLLHVPIRVYSDIDKKYIANNMIRYGGSFVKSLGTALLKADSVNEMKIYRTWPDYMKKYSKM